MIPTSYARDEDSLLVHGSSASRMMRTLEDGVDVCVTVTHNDGLVLARSAFHHSMNYRSVVVLGRSTPVVEREEKMDALRKLVEHLIPGRWDEGHISSLPSARTAGKGYRGNPLPRRPS